LLRELELRTRELREAWKPKLLGWALTVWWVWHAVKHLGKRAGPFNNLILACSALVLVVLYTIPSKSVQLLPKRVLAFAIDLALLSVLTVGVMVPLYEGDVVAPSAIVSLVIVWAWFFAFVLVDWKLRGTPGQLVLGLRLKKKTDSSHSRLDLISCLARNFLALLLPVVIAGWLLIIPITYSRPEKVIRLAAGYTVLAILPLSIAFTGGHLLSDLLLRVSVIPKRSGFSQYPSHLNKKRCASLVIAALLMGSIFALAQNLESEMVWKPPTTPFSETYQSEPSVSAWLWPRLQQGIPSPAFFVQNVEAYSVPGSLKQEIYSALGSTSCSGARKPQGPALLVEVQVEILTPTTVKGLLYANLAEVTSAEAPANKRPSFLLFDLTTREDFGTFSLARVESSALCLGEVNGKPTDTYVMTGLSDRVRWWSVILLSQLVRGELGIYSYIQRLPIWSQS
jgi:hypothetical protein